MRYHNLIARIPVRPVLSHGVVEDAKHTNAQARACACQLRLHFFPRCETLPQVLQGNGMEWCFFPQSVLVPSVSKTPAA